MRNVITGLVLVLMLTASACGGSPLEPTMEPVSSDTPVEAAEVQGDSEEMEDESEPAAAQEEVGSEPSEDFIALTEAQTEYLDAAGDIADGYAVWFGELTDQIDLVIADSTLFDDETWRAESEEILDNISRLNQEVRDLASPEGCEKIHGHFLDAAEHYESFVSLYADGIDELDVEKIDRAIDEMVAGSEVIGKASESIDELVE